MSRPSGLSAWNVLLAPFAASAYIYALLRSMIVTLRHGGVTWRGTFYPLAELRKNAAPSFLNHCKAGYDRLVSLKGMALAVPHDLRHQRGFSR